VLCYDLLALYSLTGQFDSTAGVSDILWFPDQSEDRFRNRGPISPEVLFTFFSVSAHWFWALDISPDILVTRKDLLGHLDVSDSDLAVNVVVYVSSPENGLLMCEIT
jgi:hypothetical protein